MKECQVLIKTAHEIELGATSPSRKRRKVVQQPVAAEDDDDTVIELDYEDDDE